MILVTLYLCGCLLWGSNGLLLKAPLPELARIRRMPEIDTDTLREIFQFLPETEWRRMQFVNHQFYKAAQLTKDSLPIWWSESLPNEDHSNDKCTMAGCPKWGCYHWLASQERSGKPSEGYSKYQKQRYNYFQVYEHLSRRWYSTWPYFDHPVLKSFRRPLPFDAFEDAKPGRLLVETWGELVSRCGWASRARTAAFETTARWLLIFGSLLVLPKERKVIALHLFTMSHGYVINENSTEERRPPYWNISCVV